MSYFQNLLSDVPAEAFQLLLFLVVFFGVLAVGGFIADYYDKKNTQPVRNYRARTGRRF